MRRGWGTAAALVAALVVTSGVAAAVHVLVSPTVPSRPAAQAPSSTVSPSSRRVPPETIPAESLDPARFPRRTITQALLLAGSVSVGEREPTVVAVDAADGEWVRAVVPGMPPSSDPRLSPDGRSLVALSWNAGTRLTLMDLSADTARDVPITSVPDGECQIDGVTWLPDSRQVVVVGGCATFGYETMEVTDPRAWVVEIDVTTGSSRTVEHLEGGYPSEAYPSVSPDGSTLVYGVGMETDDEGSLGGVHALDLRTGETRHLPDLHLEYGDPWRDADTVLAWNQSMDAPNDDRVLVDVRTGEVTPLEIESLFGLSGFVGGQLAIAHTPWLDRTPPCPVSYCLADPSRSRSPRGWTRPAPGPWASSAPRGTCCRRAESPMSSSLLNECVEAPV